MANAVFQSAICFQWMNFAEQAKQNVELRRIFCLASCLAWLLCLCSSFHFFYFACDCIRCSLSVTQDLTVHTLYLQEAYNTLFCEIADTSTFLNRYCTDYFGLSVVVFRLKCNKKNRNFDSNVLNYQFQILLLHSLFQVQFWISTFVEKKTLFRKSNASEKWKFRSSSICVANMPVNPIVSKCVTNRFYRRKIQAK